MDSTDFSILIGRLDREADERPQLYAAKVALVAALGYLGLALVAGGILLSCYYIIRSIVAVGRPSGWMLIVRRRCDLNADRDGPCALGAAR